MLLIVILIILAIIVLANVRTVHQGHVQIVERLGKFHDAWGAGLHVKVPFIDAVRKDVSLKDTSFLTASIKGTLTWSPAPHASWNFPSLSTICTCP